jgi:Protein of unknown function (DUF1822)
MTDIAQMPPSVLIPITQAAQQIARQFAIEQPTEEKSLQVYLNTLAVYAVNNYLRIMDISTDLTVGDSWNPAIRFACDVADLWVTDVGRLECRPLPVMNRQSAKPAAISCYVPPETQDERIGYVVVQIDLEQQEATLLGFAPTVTSEELIINELQPITEMLKNLENQTMPLVPLANLSQWWQGRFEVSWQSVEEFLDNAIAPSSLHQVAFRRSITQEIRRAKLINFGRHKPGLSVTLVVTLTQQETSNSIVLQVFPQAGETFLPTDLKLAVLDESGISFFEISSGSNDRFIQSRQFSGQPGEQFCVQLSLGKISLMEDFAI